MPNPKNPASYPIDLFGLTDSAPFLIDPVEFRAPDRRSGEILRRKWYSFIYSCERKDALPDERLAASRGRSLEVSLRDNPDGSCSIIFTPRNTVGLLAEMAQSLKEQALAQTGMEEFNLRGITEHPETEEPEPDYSLHRIPSDSIKPHEQ